MQRSITIRLGDETYAALRRRARTEGVSPEHMVASVIEHHLESEAASQASGVEAVQQPRRGRLERYFGAVDLGRATGVENEQIDADLAKAYGERSDDG